MSSLNGERSIAIWFDYIERDESDMAAFSGADICMCFWGQFQRYGIERVERYGSGRKLVINRNIWYRFIYMCRGRLRPLGKLRESSVHHTATGESIGDYTTGLQLLILSLPRTF
jgi:hypothetical protein